MISVILSPKKRKIFIRQNWCFLALYKAIFVYYHNITAYPIDSHFWESRLISLSHNPVLRTVFGPPFFVFSTVAYATVSLHFLPYTNDVQIQWKNKLCVMQMSEKKKSTWNPSGFAIECASVSDGYNYPSDTIFCSQSGYNAVNFSISCVLCLTWA